MSSFDSNKYIRCCILGAIGVAFVAAGDWLLGCVPLHNGDDGMFNRAYYLSGGYGLWRSVLVLLHPVMINVILVIIPDIAQTFHEQPETWMAVMSQSSTNTSIIIWCIAAAYFEQVQKKARRQR